MTRITNMGPAPQPLVDRIADSMEPDPETGCWVWTGTIGDDGYGRMQVGSRADGSRRQRVAHRVVYEQLVGPIPTGLDLDHLCHNGTDCPGGLGCPHRRCVNPAHLEPVTRRENLRRGKGPAAEGAAKTHCLRGHEFTEGNTYRAPNGTRKCKACMRLRRLGLV